MPSKRSRDAPAGVLLGDGTWNLGSAPIHDAILVEGAAEAIEEVVAETQRAMGVASEIVTGGFLRVCYKSHMMWSVSVVDSKRNDPGRHRDRRSIK